MPYSNISELPPQTKNLSVKQKERYLRTFNATLESGESEATAFAVAMTAAKKVHKSFAIKAPEKQQLNKSFILEAITKAASVDDEQMISVEIVYEPDTPDAHNQWMSADTIEQGCLNFNKNYELGNCGENLFHQEMTDSFTILKSWINYALDVTVDETGEKIKAGTWLALIKYNDPQLWDMKKQKIVGGLSIQCSGLVNSETGEITDLNFDPEYSENNAED